MSDLAPTGRAEAARLADRVRREVVMQEEAAFDLAGLKVVHKLLVLFRAERRGDKRLRFAARKESRAVRARQQAHFTINRANLREAPAIWPTAFVQNVVAEDFLFQMIEDALGHLRSEEHTSELQSLAYL